VSTDTLSSRAKSRDLLFRRSPGTNVTLENARVVQDDCVEAKPLGFSNGYVAPTIDAESLRIDLRDHLIFPGLINAHDHLQLNAIPRLMQSEAFDNSYQWIDAFESYLKERSVLAATRVPSETRHWHGALKNLLAGVTLVAHHDPSVAVFGDPEFPVRLLEDAGWSHSLGLGIAPTGGLPRYGPPVRESFCATSSERPWVIHLAEGTDDVAAEELAELDALGCLSANTVIVHGVGLTRSDVDRVIERGAAVVWCPASNLAMLGRTLDPRRLFDAGQLTLGTDSRLTGSRDLLDELRCAAESSDLTPKELLRLVTADASRVLRMPQHGGLNAGQHADCVIVRADHDDPYEVLLRTNRSSIRAVVRHGVPVVADPDFAGWFASCGVDAVELTLDGKPKLISRSVLRAEASTLEPGLEASCAS
jgi:cytosine/adenosine deaminase-related metal-dependent hydrolase